MHLSLRRKLPPSADHPTFLSLPPEIRLQIYSHLFPYPPPPSDLLPPPHDPTQCQKGLRIEHCCAARLSAHLSARLQNQHALLLTCRLLRAEARPLAFRSTIYPGPVRLHQAAYAHRCAFHPPRLRPVAHLAAHAKWLPRAVFRLSRFARGPEWLARSAAADLVTARYFVRRPEPLRWVTHVVFAENICRAVLGPEIGWPNMERARVAARALPSVTHAVISCEGWDSLSAVALVAEYFERVRVVAWSGQVDWWQNANIRSFVGHMGFKGWKFGDARFACRERADETIAALAQVRHVHVYYDKTPGFDFEGVVSRPWKNDCPPEMKE